MNTQTHTLSLSHIHTHTNPDRHRDKHTPHRECTHTQRDTDTHTLGHRQIDGETDTQPFTYAYPGKSNGTGHI